MLNRKKIEELEARLEEALFTINSYSQLLERPQMKAALEQQKIEDEKLAAYNQLVKQPFKYDIMKDLVTAADHGVVVKLIVDGVPIEIRRDEEPKKNKFSNDLF